LNLSNQNVPLDAKGVSPTTPAERAAPGNRSRAGIEAVVFFTHLFDHSIERRYLKLKSDLGKLAQIFILAPLGSAIPHEYLDETYFFDYNRLRSGAAQVIGDQLLPGNVHLVAIDSLNAGTLRHRPPHYFPRLRRNTIFHPVKAGSSNRENGGVQFLKGLHLRELLVRCAVSFYYNLLSLWRLPKSKEEHR
jgi:hypothetical protein